VVVDHLHAAYDSLLTKNKNLTHVKSQAVYLSFLEEGRLPTLNQL
jgi:hypothetical protein